MRARAHARSIYCFISGHARACKLIVAVVVVVVDEAVYRYALASAERAHVRDKNKQMLIVMERN